MSDELPSVNDSGVSGTQLEGSSTELAPTLAPLEGVLVGTVKGIAERNPRGLGGGTNAALMTGIVHHITEDADRAKKRLEERDLQILSLRDELTSAKVENATLSERVSAARTHSRIGQWSGILGTTILGLTVDMYKNQISTWPIVCVVGAVVIALPLLLNLGKK